MEITNVLMTLFGLRHVKNTRVGDAALRGVSGGEKKRVSISEILATRNLLACWDKYVGVTFSDACGVYAVFEFHAGTGRLHCH